MLKSFRLLVTFLVGFTATIGVFAQDDVKYKDVVLDGKPAKLNLATGEVTHVNAQIKNGETKTDSVKTKPALTAYKTIINDSNDEGADYYTVKEGDNLFKIAVKYETNLTELKKANNLETTLIKKGQKLRIRNFDRVANHPAIWIVKKGDNLYRIAIDNGTTVEAIKRINGLTSDVIKIGQKLQLN